MLRRKNERIIRDFLRNEKRALLVTGARQTGKTFTVRQVAREFYDHVVEINFIESPEAKAIFTNPRNAQEILLRLSAFSQTPMVPDQTLIFLDEIQECKEIVTAIKFLVDEGSYRYVLSGSLLGIELQDVRSIPVGYMSVLEMYPLDFEEFADAVGVSNDVLSHLHDCFLHTRAVDEFVHQRMLELVRHYLLVGGMPAVVQTYIDTNNVKNIVAAQQDIIHAYKLDISKYATEKKLQIDEIYDLIPAELNAKNKRFILKKLNEKARFKSYENDFLWLKNAGVAIPVYNVEEPTLPLLLGKQRNLFKLFLSDVGLLAAMYGNQIQMRLFDGDININNGAIYENLVAQELCAHGLSANHSLYYFNSKKQGELDFVIEYDNHVLPIEVKSGKDYARHNALSNVLANTDYDIPRAIVLCQDNISTSGKITYLPIYMTMFLQRRQPTNHTIHFDPTGLSSAATR